MHPIVCLPGHKRLKLWPDALALTGATAQSRVSRKIEKFFVTAGGGDVHEPLPLGGLFFLEDGADTAFAPIAGSERFLRLDDDHYTAELFAIANRPNRAERFALSARLAAAMPMFTLVRPRDARQFDATCGQIARHIRALAGEDG